MNTLATCGKKCSRPVAVLAEFSAPIQGRLASAAVMHRTALGHWAGEMMHSSADDEPLPPHPRGATCHHPLWVPCNTCRGTPMTRRASGRRQHVLNPRSHPTAPHPTTYAFHKCPPGCFDA